MENIRPTNVLISEKTAPQHQDVGGQDESDIESFRLLLPGWVHTYILSTKAEVSPTWLRNPVPTSLHAASAKRQRDFLAGRFCAMRALQSAGLVPIQEIGIAESGLPRWPDGWTGSISHSKGIAVAAVANKTLCCALGIDVEERIDQHIANEISSQISSPEELLLLDTFELPTALTIIFSAKESLYKALYPFANRFFDFSAARVSGFSETMLHLSLTENWSALWPKDTWIPVQYTIVREHVFTAVCIPRGESDSP